MAEGSASAQVLQITVEDVREQNAKILQLIDLPALLPPLEETGILTQEIIKKISDSKHHGQFERCNFLLSYLYQRGQEAIDAFIECLRQGSDQNDNHAKILTLLEGDVADYQPRSPLFQILDSHLDTFETHVDLLSLLNALIYDGAIQVNTFLDLQNTDRTVGENLEKLFQVLQKEGTRGFIKLLSSLQRSFPNPGHEKLSELLFEEVNKFFKQNPQQDVISQSDKIEILQLETKEKVVGHDIHQRIIKHRQKLVAQMNLPALFPSLHRHQVISKQERDYLSQLVPSTQNDEFFDLLLKRELSSLVKFVDCLLESPVNKDIGGLFSTSSASVSVATTETKTAEEVLEKYDKMAVFVCGEVYFTYNGSNSLKEEQFDLPIQEHRKTLEKHLEAMDFKVKTLETSIDLSRVESGCKDQSSKSITEKFKNEITRFCNEGAIVFIFLSGLQFPCKDPKRSPRTKDYGYSGAVLRSDASKFGRLPLDSIECQDLNTWVELLPKAHVTFLIDTFPSHEAAFDKRQQVSKAEIMLDPWDALTSLKSNTVVFFLRPDPKAMARERGKEHASPLGMLTETFIKALVSCVRKTKEEVSHRSLYEALSFYWHACQDGRQHKLYIPAIGGDVDRAFLGKNTVPYQQVFRAVLVRNEPPNNPQKKETTKDIFNLKQLKIPTGTMAGLIQGDQLEIFHVLRPGVRVGGRVSEAYQLHSLAVVDEGEGRSKVHEVLDDLYQNGEFESKDGSLEFLFARKRFPLHQRVAVYPQELSRSDVTTLKTYIKDSSLLLTTVTNKQEAKVVVSHNGLCYVVQDMDNDVRYKIETATVQKVKSMLEIIAWYKYVKELKPRQKASNVYECSLTAERPLLSAAAPLCHDFRIESSSWIGAAPFALGYEAIMNFSDPPEFWTPALEDRTPTLAVNFKKNQIVTAIELRSDPIHNKFMKSAFVMYQKIIEQARVDMTSETGTTKRVTFAHNEAVRYVTITPRVGQLGTAFTLTMRIIVRRVQGAKHITGDIDGLGIHNLHLRQQAGWKFNPPLDQRSGHIQLAPERPHFTWSGTSAQPIIFDLGPVVVMERIEFVDLSNPATLKNFDLLMETDRYPLDIPEITSAWPKKYTFPRPVIASRISIHPSESESPPHKVWEPPASEFPGAGDIRLQLQLYGNVYGEPLKVDEEDILTFQFNNLSDKLYYVYLLCLEETGDISFINEDGVEARTSFQDSNERRIYPPLKQLLRTTIPEGYIPASGRIQDVYRVWVSQTKLYIEPFCQRGVHKYHETCCYNVCTQGHRSRVIFDEWNDHQYKVNISKP